MHMPLLRLPPYDPPPPPAPTGPAEEPACGWYASSFELRRGLSVTEHADLRALARDLPPGWPQRMSA